MSAAAKTKTTIGRTDWPQLSRELTDALRHIETLADTAFGFLNDNAEARGPVLEDGWAIPHHCMNDISALLFAIRSTAAHAQGAER